jgi:hypothetical protein
MKKRGVDRGLAPHAPMGWRATSKGGAGMQGESIWFDRKRLEAALSVTG